MWLFFTLVITAFWFSTFAIGRDGSTEVQLEHPIKRISDSQVDQTIEKSLDFTRGRSNLASHLDCRYQEHVELRELVPLVQPTIEQKSPQRQPKQE